LRHFERKSLASTHASTRIVKKFVPTRFARRASDNDDDFGARETRLPVMDGIPPVPFSGLPDEASELQKPPSMSGVVYLTRGVSPGFAAAQRMEDDGTLDAALARKEHEAFVALLRDKGGPSATVVDIPADPHQPDCVFVEDTLVALPGRGVLRCAPHDSRAGEVPPVADAAASVSFELPAGRVHVDGEALASNGERIEGGDVLYVRGGDDVYHHYFVGVGNRSNSKGADALRRALKASAARARAAKPNADASKNSRAETDDSALFRVHEIDMSLDKTWLHLKSALTWAPYVGFVVSSTECPLFRAVRDCLQSHEATSVNKIKSDPVVVERARQGAANVLVLPGGVVFCHPAAAAEVKKAGGKQIEVVAVEQPELGRADGALTCGVLVLDPFFEWGSFS
jgi:dimethylargininase